MSAKDFVKATELVAADLMKSVSVPDIVDLMMSQDRTAGFHVMCCVASGSGHDSRRIIV